MGRGFKNFRPTQPNSTQPTYEKLIEHLIYYYIENPANRLDDTKYLEKIENEVNNYVNPYTICDNIDFNCLMLFIMFLGFKYIFMKTTMT